jgi:CheY-like chemotaxis protein
MVDETIQPLAFRAHGKGLSLACQISPEVPQRLVGDSLRLRQVIINLVANAIKFTERGQITVRVDVEQADAAGVRLRFQVQDTGVGMSAEQQQRVFEPFVQADGSTTRRYGGTGLGLTISRRLVEMMGGRLEIQSELTKGSTFSFTVNLAPASGEAPAAAASPEPAAPAALRPLRVLIVEDNAVNQIVATRFLAKHKHSVVAVGNGREALGALQRDPAAFDLVLMDIQMPEMDGIDATAAIRRTEAATGAHLPIVAMTAHALKGDRERCLAAGMDGYVSKPILPAMLFAEIERVLGRTAAPKPSQQPADTGPSPAQHFDRAALMERVEGDVALLAQMVGIFEGEGDRLMAAIDSAIRAGDAHTLERAAHTLKGMVSNFTATPAAAAAARLEELGRNQKLDESAAAFRALQQELAALRPLLSELCEEVPS